MDDLKALVKEEPVIIPKDFCLEKFSRTYILEALRLVESGSSLTKSGISLDEFDNGLQTIVSARLGITKNAVNYLHHSFHWFFFDDNPISPLEYTQSTIPLEKARISKREVSNGGLNLTEEYLKMYGAYFQDRVKARQQVTP